MRERDDTITLCRYQSSGEMSACTWKGLHTALNDFKISYYMQIVSEAGLFDEQTHNWEADFKVWQQELNK